MGKKEKLLGDRYEIISEEEKTPFNQRFEVIESPVPSMRQGFNPNELIQNHDKFNEVLNNIEDVSEDEKNVIKKLALAAHDGDKGVTSADVSDAILTLQRQHPLQEGGNKYYMKEVAPDVYKPIPIKNNEKPPKGYDVASIWGTQSSANDDTAVTSLGKHLWNGVVGAAEGVVNLAGLGYGATTGEDAEWYQTLKNSAKSLKFNTPDYEKGDIFNTEGIKSASDFFDPSRYDFSKDKVQGAIFQGMESLTSFLLGTKGVSGVTGATSKAGKLGEAYVGSYAVNYGESLQAAEDAGLTGREKYAYAGITTVPTAALDVAFGTEGLFVKNQMARDAKKTMLNSLAKGFKEDAGKLTKESLEDLYKVTTAAATNLNKSFARQLGENVLEEAGTESAQALVQNGAQMIYDQLSKDPKFGTDAFSLESIGEYLNNAIGGAFGAAGPGVYGVSQERKASKTELQNSNVYEAVKKGVNSVEALKADVYSSYKSGDLTKEEAANAVTKINAYYDFNKQLGDNQIGDEDRKKVLDLAFQKELIYQSIKDTDTNKLNPIELAQYESKSTIAKDIQKQINDIVLKQTVKDEPIVSDKTKEDILKKEEKAGEGITIKPTEKKVKVDERKFEEIKPVEWNTKKYSERFNILTRDLTEPVQGELTLESGGEGRTTSDTVHVKLPGSKFTITASSARDLVTQLRGHFKTEFVNDIEGLPIVVKPTQLTSGKTVLGVYNEDNGKFISYIREDDKGKSKYSDAEIEQLQHLQAVGKLSNAEREYYKSKRQPPPTEGEAGVMEPIVPKTPVTPQGNLKPITNDTTTQQERGAGITARTEKPVTGDVSETAEQDVKAVKETKLRTGTKRSQRKIKSPERLKALAHEVTDPYHVVLQYFAGDGTISTSAIGEIFGSKTKVNKDGDAIAFGEKWGRKSYATAKKNSPKGTETVDALAHTLWEANRDKTPNATVEKYRDEIEKAVSAFDRPTRFAKELNKILGEKEQKQTFENEQAYNDYHDKLEELGLSSAGNDVADKLERLSTEELSKLANMPEKEFDEFGNEIVGIILRDDINNAEDVFQKPKELEYAEGQFAKADKDLKAAKTAFNNKRKELGKEFNEDQEDLFGERKSDQGGSLFDERVDMSAYESAIAPFKQRYDAAVVEYNKWKKKVEDLQGREDSQTSLFQKEASEKAKSEALTKIVDKLKKSMPKVKVVYDENMEAAGRWSPKTNTITINPFYAGLDTPIHEYGHVLIDAIGYNNKVIQAAIKQLKGTPLWTETKQRYKDHNEEMLAKEVLAEAIGLEGAGIFDKEADKSKFRQYLEYIFDWLKTKLGLNKNVAKSLAKQIIAGIGTKEMAATDVKEEQLQKPKSLEEKSEKELDFTSIGSFDAYRAKVLNRPLQQMRRIFKDIKGKLNNPDISAEEQAKLAELKAYYDKQEAEDLKAYRDYKNDMKVIKEISEEKNIDERSTDELIDVYNTIINYQPYAKGTMLNDVMKKIAMSLYDKRVNALKNDPELSKKFNAEQAKFQDLTTREVWLKVLSHMTQNFPELQELSKLYDSAVFAKEKEAKEKKLVLERLGKEVIKEKNKQLGITDKAKSLLMSDSSKYFEYLDNGQGELLTINEAKKKGLSAAQIEFLKYMRELIAEREGALEEEDIYNKPMEVIKADKSVMETFKSEGTLQAFSHLLGDTFNISSVRIPFVDPNNNKSTITEYKNIEKEIIKYGKQGLPQMIRAMGLLLKYNIKARKQLKTGRNYDQVGDKENVLKVVKGGEYTLNGNGQLIGKFDRKRDKSRGYSKDFYKSAMSFIEDTAHVKHLTPLMPIVNSIEHINRTGVTNENGELIHGEKPNVVKWIEEWRDMHIFKKQRETIPEVDVTLKFLRFLTSATTMWFNVPAGVMNVAIGMYNNWRAEMGPIIRKGNTRLYKDGAYARGILHKYNVVSTDIDSNPKLFVGRLFDNLANGLTRYGEFMIQGSGVLGLMTEEDYNSFEFKKDKHGVEKLVVKEGVDEKALEQKILSLRNRITDIQGKYSDKDKRNAMNNELGKAAFQFKVWIPDWLKERFGGEYITSDGVVHRGSYTVLFGEGLRDLRKQINEKGAAKAIWENKEMMANIKGLMFIASLMILANSDDDDKEKTMAAKFVERGLGDLLFIFNVNDTDKGIKPIIERPIASIGVLTKFIDSVDHLFAFEEADYNKRTGNPKIVSDIVGFMPGKKVIDVVDYLSEDEE